MHNSRFVLYKPCFVLRLTDADIHYLSVCFVVLFSHVVFVFLLESDTNTLQFIVDIYTQEYMNIFLSFTTE